MISLIAHVHSDFPNLGRFLDAYDWVNRIYLIDSNSENPMDIYKILREHRKVSIEHTHMKDYRPKYDYLAKRAKQDGAKWIIYGNPFIIPNFRLKKHARILINTSERPVVSVYSVFLYRSSAYSKKLSSHIPWAVRSDYDYTSKFYGKSFLEHSFSRPDSHLEYKLKIPFSLLNFSMNDAYRNRKVASLYKQLSCPMVPEYGSLLGTLKPLEWWMDYDCIIE